MLTSFIKRFLVLTLLLLGSCTSLKKDNSRRIRIVDLQGQSRDVRTRVPELNAQILRSQGRMPQDGNLFSAVPGQVPAKQVQQNPQQQNRNFSFNGSVKATDANVEKNKYAAAEYEAASVELARQKAQTREVPATQIIEELKESKVQAGSIFATKGEVVEYDLSGGSNNKIPSKKVAVLRKYNVSSDGKPSKVAAKKSEKKANRLRGIYIQTGAFSNMRNAKRSANVMRRFGKVQIEESRKGKKKVYRVLLGSFQNKTKARKVLKQVKSAGHDAIIVRKK